MGYVDSLTEENVRFNASGNRLTIIGSINCSSPGDFMTKFIDDFHDNIIKNGIKEVIVDLKLLKFLNSSGIKEFVTWILRIPSLPAEQKYHIKFLSNKDYAWQETSISTLIILDPDTSEIIYDEQGTTSTNQTQRPSSNPAVSDSSLKTTPASVFPINIKCPKCNKVLKTSKSGRFRCPICSTIITINERGSVFTS